MQVQREGVFLSRKSGWGRLTTEARGLAMLNHWLLVCQDSESPLASTTTSSAVPGGQGVGVGGGG